MSIDDFGWDYPPGTAQDPQAPWNERDEDEERPPTRAEIEDERRSQREDEDRDA